MATMDAFRSDVFGAISLSGIVQTMDYKPSMLGDMGIFDVKPVRTHRIFVDRIDGVLNLIPNSPMGAPPNVMERHERSAVALEATRLAERFTIYAHEIQGLRAVGSETELESVQTEFMREMVKIRQRMELTHEHHRLGAIQGKVLDSDGVTVLHDFFERFGEAEAAGVSFDLDDPDTMVRQKCSSIVRGMAQSARGAFTTSTRVHALAGDEFYDKLIDHPNVREAYKFMADAGRLRAGAAYESFDYAGITFHNYRGTDDNSSVAVPTDEARFFPVGAQEMFEVAYAPFEGEQFVNTPGQEVYALTVPDRERDMWTMGELYSYPLYMCKQPRVLRQATVAA